jgi:holo-[acyl-carrier protein] synthase
MKKSKCMITLRHPIQSSTFLGGRFAAKEALFKAIRSGHGKTYYKDFSILSRPDGSPYVKTEYFKQGEIITYHHHTHRCTRHMSRDD